MVKLVKVAKVIVGVILIWAIITTLIYQFSNPKKTQTEAFFHTFKSMSFDFTGE